MSTWIRLKGVAQTKTTLPKAHQKHWCGWWACTSRGRGEMSAKSCQDSPRFRRTEPSPPGRSEETPLFKKQNSPQPLPGPSRQRSFSLVRCSRTCSSAVHHGSRCSSLHACCTCGCVVRQWLHPPSISTKKWRLRRAANCGIILLGCLACVYFCRTPTPPTCLETECTGA